MIVNGGLIHFLYITICIWIKTLCIDFMWYILRKVDSGENNFARFINENFYLKVHFIEKYILLENVFQCKNIYLKWHYIRKIRVWRTMISYKNLCSQNVNKTKHTCPCFNVKISFINIIIKLSARIFSIKLLLISFFFHQWFLIH